LIFYHDVRARIPFHLLNAAKVFFKLFALTLKPEDLLFGKPVDASVFDHGIEFFEAVDSLLDCFKIGKHPAQPSLVDKKHAATVGFFLDGVTGLLLGTYEKNAFARGYGIGHELVGCIEKPDGALQIYDINPVASAKDKGFHFGVPPAGLMAEMNPCFQQLFHSNNCHRSAPSGFASAPLYPAAHV
jgi:hypothetical protein